MIDLLILAFIAGMGTAMNAHHWPATSLTQAWWVDFTLVVWATSILVAARLAFTVLVP